MWIGLQSAAVYSKSLFSHRALCPFHSISSFQNRTLTFLSACSFVSHVLSFAIRRPPYLSRFGTTTHPLTRPTPDPNNLPPTHPRTISFKLHGAPRPISMKSDVIRKRSRHEARRASLNGGETPSASPGASRRASPEDQSQSLSPVLAPDSSTYMPVEYEYANDGRGGNEAGYGGAGEGWTQQGQQGQGHGGALNLNLGGAGHVGFPGPYHPDYIHQMLYAGAGGDSYASNTTNNNTSNNAGGDSSDVEDGLIGGGRSTKRRRMSNDSGSATDPPSSAVSYSSFSDNSYTSASTSSATSASATSSSARNSIEFPFSYSYTTSPSSHTNPLTTGIRNYNAFLHPPMLPQTQTQSPPTILYDIHGQTTFTHGVHPPMLPPPDYYLKQQQQQQQQQGKDSPMDFLHPPMLPPEDENTLFATYLHPPMALPEEQSGGDQGQQGQQQEGRQERHPPMFPSDWGYGGEGGMSGY